MQVTLPTRICDKLGLGLAKQLYKQILEIHQKNNSRTIPFNGVKTAKQRKKACEQIVASHGPLKVDAMAGADYLSMRTLYLSPESIGDQLVLAVNMEVVDLAPRRLSILPLNSIDYERHTLVTISMHAIQRMIQRGGVRDIAGLIDLIGRAANWTGISNYRRHSGAFMVPCANGMLCCDTVLNLADTRPDMANVRATLIKTFIGMDQMQGPRLAIWQHMVDHGALRDVPRIIKTFDPKIYYPCFEVMAEEGRLWQERLNARKAYA